MNYCSYCAGQLILQVPAGDNRQRYVCIHCEQIYYSNPKVVTGCLIEHENQILLCKRNIEPRKGLWTLPAGFLENNETCEEGAIRETKEETQADVEVQQLFLIYDIPHISQIYMIYLAQMKQVQFGPTLESSEVKLFSQAEIPWDDIAFPVIDKTLKHFYQAKQAQNEQAQPNKLPNFDVVLGKIDRRKN